MAATTKRFLLPELSNPDYTPSIPNPDPYATLIHLKYIYSDSGLLKDETVEMVWAIILEGDETVGKAIIKDSKYLFNDVVKYDYGIIQKVYPEDYIFSWYNDPSVGDERIYMLLDAGSPEN
tara:strand:+ start:2841 stop:3203 length:363 start_codon:yes stop_codon:yes gene_type:complete